MLDLMILIASLFLMFPNAGVQCAFGGVFRRVTTYRVQKKKRPHRAAPKRLAAVPAAAQQCDQVLATGKGASDHRITKLLPCLETREMAETATVSNQEEAPNEHLAAAEAIAAAASTEEGGGEPATVVSPGDTASAGPPGASESAEGIGGGGGVAGAQTTSAGGGRSSASEPEKRDSAKEMGAPASNAPVKEPLGPGPFGLDDFDTGVTLGTGSFGRVRIATHKATQTPWAIKMLKKAEIIRMQQVEHMVNEKTILMKMNHPFIVKLAGTFHDERSLYMILEYVVGGEFFSHLRRANRFENHVGRFFGAHVALMFEYMHSMDVIYRDLKPENLLLDRQGYLKITDFGFAKIVAFKTYTLCGTPEYIAPEVLLNQGHGKGVDWWTMGILVYEMLVGQPPFVDNDPLKVYQLILAGKLAFPRFIDKNAKSLIKKLLVADLTKRYGCVKGGAQDVKSHKWFAGFDFEELLARAIPPPIVPQVEGAMDTSQFDPYPDSVDLPDIPTFTGKDPFAIF